MTSLQSKIEDRSAVIGVIGLGYVGLPAACMYADAGFRVIGVDIDADRVNQIAAGTSPVGGREPGLEELLGASVSEGRLEATIDYGLLADADIVTLNVDTPVSSDGVANYTSLRAAADALGRVITPGTLVIVESTVGPGTTLDVVAPAIEQASGLTAGVGFHMGACPERVMPGKLLLNLRTVPRVVGGDSLETAETMRLFYATIVEAEIDLTDVSSAEMVKVTENTYRDVQIAFANEIAVICRRLGLDVWEIRDLVNKVPFRDMHRPGGGVGGHCIPKDPWLLANSAHPDDIRLIPAARHVNDSMPEHVVDVTFERIPESIKQPVVLVLGVAYLPESDDTRNSPSLKVLGLLEQRGAITLTHDPYVPGHDGELSPLIAKADAVVLMVHHPEYEGLDLNGRLVVDAQRLTERRK